jgi:hypothetical protein
MSEVQKDLEDLSAGIGQFLKNPIFKDFVLNFMSKLARLVLTPLIELGLKKSLWTPGYTPADRLTSQGVLHYPCTVPVYKLLFISQ